MMQALLKRNLIELGPIKRNQLSCNIIDDGLGNKPHDSLIYLPSDTGIGLYEIIREWLHIKDHLRIHTIYWCQIIVFILPIFSTFYLKALHRRSSLPVLELESCGHLPFPNARLSHPSFHDVE
jgi:hypothetical protein